MTREEAVNMLKSKMDGHTDTSYEWAETVRIAIKALEQESESKQFAEWVAEEIFDENWEYNKDAFAELACRKLAKLGIVRANGDVWELVEPQERSE